MEIYWNRKKDCIIDLTLSAFLKNTSFTLRLLARITSIGSRFASLAALPQLFGSGAEKLFFTIKCAVETLCPWWGDILWRGCVFPGRCRYLCGWDRRAGYVCRSTLWKHFWSRQFEGGYCWSRRSLFFLWIWHFWEKRCFLMWLSSQILNQWKNNLIYIRQRGKDISFDKKSE